MTIKDIILELETLAPPAYQESYDNSRLIVGDVNQKLEGVLISLDCIEAVVEEAIQKRCNMIISHHPIVFTGLKSLTGKNYVERTVIKAIQNNIALYAIHTNLDNVSNGVNKKIAERLGLSDVQILAPKSNVLSKLVTFVPVDHAESVLKELYKAGAGEIGNYDHCSFKSVGEGSFRPNSKANPFLGSKNKEEQVREQRLELMFPSNLNHRVIQALKQSHPYEEVAYYLTALINQNQEIGAGMIGNLMKPMPAIDFLMFVKDRFDVPMMRHTRLVKQEISRVAVCGGSGSFLLSAAKSRNADVFITADFKYHEFFDAESDLIIADIGHYESEVFTKELIYDYLKEKIANIALNLSEVGTNPINYL